MIIKIDTCKIMHQINVMKFFWKYNNFIESKIKQIAMTNSKSIKY
jgi:hypothetical protein